MPDESTGPSKRWEDIGRIFAAAAQLPAAEREQYLRCACAGDAELLREVRSLIAHDEPGSAEIAEILGSAAASLVKGGSRVGSRFGAYVATALVGSGGMGSVYLGSRADDQFQKQVAIKVVKRGMDTDAVLERFRRERQILANLEHPYIARLLDGAATPDGLPYLVMDYVQGKPIDEFCAERGLGLGERCELFRKVCEAVSYAHRNLVIHRDLKPNNILVTAAGTPVLLDFGIARILAPGEDLTVDPAAQGRPLTPAYASPEHVRGGPITTASDVYSLGATLYRLLAGVSPHQITGNTPKEVETAVCEREPARPSAVDGGPFRRQLAGDLDAILLTALRKEAARRYQSVDQFSEDLRRHFAGLPVMARKDSAWYVAGKFLRRHRLGAAAAALIACTLTAAVIATTWQARNAEAQRQIAEARSREAERERARAEMQSQTANREHAAAARERDAALRASAEARVHELRARDRLKDLAGMASVALLDIHDPLERLPGATATRKQMVSATLKYLERLGSSSGNDVGILDVLVNAYSRLGDVQGRPNHPNLGDTAGALASYRKAVELLNRRRALAGDSDTVLWETVEIQARLGLVLGVMGRQRESVDAYLAALSAAQAGVRREPGSTEPLASVCSVELLLASQLSSVKTAESLGHARNGVAACEEALARRGDDPALLEHLADGRSSLGRSLAAAGEQAAALQEFQRAASIRERLVALKPNDALAQRMLMLAYGHIGDTLGAPFLPNLGRPEEALSYYRKASAIAAWLAQADARNPLARYDLAQTLFRQGSLAPFPDGMAESLKVLRQAADIEDGLRKEDPNNLRHPRVLSMIYESIGARLSDMGDRQAAVASYRKSLAIAESLAAETKDTPVRLQVLMDYRAMARLSAQNGNREEAVRFVEKTLTAAEGLIGDHRAAPRLALYLARAWKWKGDVYHELARGDAEASQRAADWLAARTAYARSVNEWKRNESTAPAAEYLEARKALAECDRQIGLLTNTAR